MPNVAEVTSLPPRLRLDACSPESRILQLESAERGVLTWVQALALCANNPPAPTSRTEFTFPRFFIAIVLTHTGLTFHGEMRDACGVIPFLLPPRIEGFCDCGVGGRELPPAEHCTWGPVLGPDSSAPTSSVRHLSPTTRPLRQQRGVPQCSSVLTLSHPVDEGSVPQDSPTPAATSSAVLP